MTQQPAMTFIPLSSLLLAAALAALPTVADAGSVASAARAAAKRAAAAAVKNSEKTIVGKPHDVILSRSRHGQAAAHVESAQRNGQPSVLHLDRKHAAEKRAAATGTVRNDRKPDRDRLYDRDEYPPAFVREEGGSVQWIDRHANRSAGAAMRAQTQHLPDGSKIRIVVGD